MRADEPAEFCKDIVPMIQKNVTRDYINQLRVERLMAKARHFWCKSCEIEMADQAGYAQPKLMKRMEQCCRISESLEARAKRIKEGM